MTGQICFLLNDRQVCTSQAPGVSVLTYLRQAERLIGTKEGCREGACGACTVLLGELDGEQVSYKVVPACLLLLGELPGKHLVTIEGLNQAQLSLVQNALVDFGATQCGFCTPGIVVSLTGYLLAGGTDISVAGIKQALSGHLCRCTGYAALQRASAALVRFISQHSHASISDLIALTLLPDYFQTIPARLRQLPKTPSDNGQTSPEFWIAGGTDLCVQSGPRLASAPVRFLSQFPEMKGISRRDGQIHIGALTTFAELAVHPVIRQLIPDIQGYMARLASWQIRQQATVGGNIMGASPIGDVSNLLVALDARLILQRDGQRRTVPLQGFYRGYKDTAQHPGEILIEIVVPVPDPGVRINVEKVSKRLSVDCASVNSAIAVHCESGIIQTCSLSIGGVAPIPLFLKQTSAYFQHKPLTKETIQGAFPILQREIAPISDIRGSAIYKRLLARQLLIAHFTQLFPELITVRDFHETH